MRTSVLYVLLLAFLGTGLPADAVDRDGNYLSLGLGDVSCRQIALDLAAGEGETKFAIQAWIQGYLTATNLKTEDTFDITGSASISDLTAWVAGYCRANPLDFLVNAIQALEVKLYSRRIRRMPD